MKHYMTFAFAFLTATLFADSSNKDAWLNGKLYGNDNNMASLRKVTIKEVGNGYKIKIDNQFAFECDLNFGSDDQPHELKSCVSTLRDGDQWYDPRMSWSASPESIALQCTSNKKEYVCEGKYMLINQNYSSESKFTIARPKTAVSNTQETASDNQDIESGLISALQLKKGTTERIGDSGKAIRAYMREGLVKKKPNQRADYTDYYLLNKPAKFMGHDLIVIEQEYMTAYIGCCVSPGVGVTVKVIGNTKNLEEFATENRCTLTEHVNLKDELSRVSIKTNLPTGNFASLSCRERDAEHPYLLDQLVN